MHQKMTVDEEDPSDKVKAKQAGKASPKFRGHFSIQPLI